ncbi:hypothetical protein [Psychromonas aquimarina]|uniref:hypothetical protein n=1 Tax=Psychromonas aquimarina TaxID=444919 RepID=UPI00041CC810|nr:hypothetical protein [Psychromonas aquimarina]
MATLDMKGPFALNDATIDKIILKESAGNYALGQTNDKDVFIVSYVGRSDSDVKQRLKHWAKNSKRPMFKYSYATSPKTAFEKECKNYHDFDEPADNDIHPDKPDNSSWSCPVCSC